MAYEGGIPVPHLRAWRLHALLSQRQLSVLSGLNKYTVMNIEIRRFNGARTGTIHQLAYALDITPQQLIEEEPPEALHPVLTNEQHARLARALYHANSTWQASHLGTTCRDWAAAPESEHLRWLAVAAAAYDAIVLAEREAAERVALLPGAEQVALLLQRGSAPP